MFVNLAHPEQWSAHPKVGIMSQGWRGPNKKYGTSPPPNNNNKLWKSPGHSTAKSPMTRPDQWCVQSVYCRVWSQSRCQSPGRIPGPHSHSCLTAGLVSRPAWWPCEGHLQHLQRKEKQTLLVSTEIKATMAATASYDHWEKCLLYLKWHCWRSDSQLLCPPDSYTSSGITENRDSTQHTHWYTLTDTHTYTYTHTHT